MGIFSNPLSGILATGFQPLRLLPGPLKNVAHPARLLPGKAGKILDPGSILIEDDPQKKKPPDPPFSLESNKALARQLALDTIPPRLAQFQEGLTALTELSNASPQALTQRLAPQIEQARAALQQMFKQVSTRFGPFGGGQAQREEARGAEAIGGQLAQFFSQLPEQARNAIIQLIENFQIVPQPATPITQVTSQPFNPASVTQSIAGGAELGKLGVRAYKGFSPPQSASILPNQGTSNPFAGEI